MSMTLKSRLLGIAAGVLMFGTASASRAEAQETTQPDTLRRDTSQIAAQTDPACVDVSQRIARMDTTSHVMADSARRMRIACNQTQSGVVDSAGHSTLGSKADQTRPDAKEPVMWKGDTLSKKPSPPDPGVRKPN